MSSFLIIDNYNFSYRQNQYLPWWLTG